MCEAKPKPEHTELVLKDMQLPSREGLVGWIRTTWLSFTGRLSTELSELFIEEIFSIYREKHSLME